MVIAARRTYNDAIRWIKSARPPRLHPWGLAAHIFRILLVGSLLLLGLMALVQPGAFGRSGSTAGGSIQWWGVAALVAGCSLWTFTRWQRVRYTWGKLREPLRRPLDHLEAFEPAFNALEASPAPLRSRFALGWVWGPAIAVIVAGLFAASASYFAIDAILARFQVGWQTPLLAAANVALSLGVLRLWARRLATWRLAFSVHRALTGSY